ncbi:glycosyl hydrolase family 61 [Colletotrichum tabaci]|uniref:lytic cellulose monooxygenase (C4-dehydrogenating) n=1 Tax=Colletotrichum tabaci TaxID=1209068 RepID=A0AAV9TRX1_9PEZI
MYTKVLISALAGATAVSAHGYVQSVTAGGETINTFYPQPGPGEAPAPDTPGWRTVDLENLDYVAIGAVGDADIICHKSATPAKLSIKVAAGDKLTLAWSSWPISHRGPIIDYLAKCAGDCSNATKADLKFFKIAEKGLTGGSWATDELAGNGDKWDVTIPSDIAPGSYVLREDIIALHSRDGAQFHPQCINLEVSGTGSASPEGVAGTSLYTAQDEGLLFDVWSDATSYPIPGPALYSSKKRRDHPRNLFMAD